MKVKYVGFGGYMEIPCYEDENGKLGIDWNTEKLPYTCNGEVFTPFETFSYSVIFENVENGKKYHWSNAENRIVGRLI